MNLDEYYDEIDWNFAFDACEAVWLLAHEWGEYAVITALQEAEFWPSPQLRYDTLSEAGQALYHLLDEELRRKYDGPV